MHSYEDIAYDYMDPWEAQFEDFEKERLQEHYRNHPECAVLAFEAYEEAKQHLAHGEWRATVAIACAAIEGCLRDAILEPLVSGVVLDENLIGARSGRRDPGVSRTRGYVVRSGAAGTRSGHGAEPPWELDACLAADGALLLK